MDGFELLCWIRRAFRPSEITVVMISASDDVTSVERCLLHGADSYMLKPASARELSLLWQFVHRRRQQQ